MPLRNFPSDISQARLLKALSKSGFVIKEGGRGSHVLVVDPKSNQFITVQYKIHKIILIKILNQAKKLGYDSEEIMKNY